MMWYEKCDVRKISSASYSLVLLAAFSSLFAFVHPMQSRLARCLQSSIQLPPRLQHTCCLHFPKFQVVFSFIHFSISIASSATTTSTEVVGQSRFNPTRLHLISNAELMPITSIIWPDDFTAFNPLMLRAIDDWI